MTLEMTRPCAAALPANWRGPNDPPGTRFRGEQTFQIYGYYPRDVIEFSTIEFSSIEFSTIEAEFLPQVEPKPAFEACPVLSLIQARMLVESAIGNRGQWSIEEIRVYAGELQSDLDSLRASLDEAAAFEHWMSREGLV